jgi:protein-S-isoprenylcysteine O-methyltransferase Ste14
MMIKTTPSVVIRIVLWLLLLVGGAIFSIARDWERAIFHSIPFHLFSFAIGMVLMTLAFRAAANGGRELSKGRIGDIPRLETNRLVTTGIYACMRHPMLFGLLLLPPAVAFLLGSPTFITLVAPLEMLFIAVMVLVFEEREVHRKFGKAYQTYRKEAPMVSLKKECLKKLFAKRKTTP